MLQYFTSNSWKDKPYLLSPFWDFFMIGGGGVVVMTFTILFASSDSETKSIFAQASPILLLIVNYPHFMMSYQLLYDGYFRKLETFSNNKVMWWRYINAGMIVPALLFIMLFYTAYMSLKMGNHRWLGYGIHIMFISAGWHYVKQSFGVFMVHSALRKVYYNGWQRLILLINSYAMWFAAMSTPPKQGSVSAKAITGVAIPYESFTPPHWLTTTCFAAAYLTSALAITIIAKSWVKEGNRFSIIAFIGYLSMYYLFGAFFQFPAAWLTVIPVFHSLQYILFVVAYQRGHMKKELRAIPEAESRKKTQFRYQRFYGYSFLLGVVFFVLLPVIIDAIYHTNIFTTLFVIFINVQHFFIDNVIWRKENKDVGEYMFSR